MLQRMALLGNLTTKHFSLNVAVYIGLCYIVKRMQKINRKLFKVSIAVK